MWRLLGLTLIFVAGTATAARADGGFERPATRGIETALHQSVALTGKRELALDPRSGLMQLQVGGALALAQPWLRATVSGAPRPGQALAHPLAFGGEGPAVRPSGLARWLETSGTKTSLAYPVTDSLSLGLGYRYLRSEDLVFKVAKTGSLDSNYQSHNLLLQAHWEF
ncbi:MAG TPA: hypothetical protein VLE23_04485 [Geminicoccaceae bacterium]|nr:hypothetical protein [Geminicoccaceae bacterium]